MTELSATQQAQEIAQGRMSALEACDAAIARIEARDGPLNAVVLRDFERARQQARERDQQRAAGVRLPLLGVPMTVKESFNVAGLPTTWGLPQFKSLVATEDAVTVQRLKAAGAVILGKTNVALMLADWQADNPVYGRTANPIDLGRTPGGSSGGAAAALASGMVALELGSDIGGSIRVPASFCGLFGHKPTWELIPQRGHGLPGLEGAPTELATVGPLARTAQDLLLAFHALAGPDEPDSVGLRLALPAPRPRHLGECRLLVLNTHPVCPTSRLVKATVARVADAAARAGAHVAHASPLLPDQAAAFEAYGTLLTTVTTQGVPGAKPIDAHRWLRLRHQQARMQRQWQQLFQQFDAVVTPAFGREAYPHIQSPNPERALMDIDGEPTVYGLQVGWPGVATFPGLPATAAPVGHSPEGLPLGVQVIGGAYQDLTTLAVAGWLAAAFSAAA
jgi:amidase